MHGHINVNNGGKILFWKVGVFLPNFTMSHTEDVSLYSCCRMYLKPHMASDTLTHTHTNTNTQTHTHTHRRESTHCRRQPSIRWQNEDKLQFSRFWRRVFLFPTSLLPRFSNSINQEPAFSPETAVFAIQITGSHDSRGRSLHIFPILIALQFHFSCSSHTVTPGRPSASSVSSIRAFSVHSNCYLTPHAAAVFYTPPALQLQKLRFP